MIERGNFEVKEKEVRCLEKQVNAASVLQSQHARRDLNTGSIHKTLF